MSDTRLAQVMPDALALVGAVRDRDAGAVADVVQRTDLPALAVALAAMVPDDAPVSELLRWTAYDVRLRPLCDPALDRSPAGCTAVHGTRSRYTAGCRGQACRQAESEYQQARHLRRKAARLAVAS